jgi:hypothetical protein
LPGILFVKDWGDGGPPPPDPSPVLSHKGGSMFEVKGGPTAKDLQILYNGEPVKGVTSIFISATALGVVELTMAVRDVKVNIEIEDDNAEAKCL